MSDKQGTRTTRISTSQSSRIAPILEQSAFQPLMNRGPDNCRLDHVMHNTPVRVFPLPLSVPHTILAPSEYQRYEQMDGLFRDR